MNLKIIVNSFEKIKITNELEKIDTNRLINLKASF